MKEVQRPERGACSITAGDISRWLAVDLKTVHNWVRRGLLAGRRTEGGHRRFFRAEVVRFLRGQGRQIPAHLREAPVRAGMTRLAPAFAGHRFSDGSGAGAVCELILEAADGVHEILVLMLDGVSDAVNVEMIRTLGQHHLTKALVLVGVAEDPLSQQSFLDAGGDAVVEDERMVDHAVAWLSGHAEQLAPGVLTGVSTHCPPAAQVHSFSDVRSLCNVPLASTR